MSEVEADINEVVGEIKIIVSKENVKWDTGSFNLPDMLFWMEVVKHMVMQKVVGGSDVIAGG